MTIKAIRSASSIGVSVDDNKSDDYLLKNGPTIPKSIADLWESLSPEVRKALIASELNGSMSKSNSSNSSSNNSTSSPTVVLSRSSSSSSTSDDAFFEQNSSLSSNSSDNGDTKEDSESSSSSSEISSIKHETCPTSGASITLIPLERAPTNVFAFTKTHHSEKSEIIQSSSAMTVTTTTKIVSTSRGWRNVFSLPISYDVNMVAHGTLFDERNLQLLDATGARGGDGGEEGYDTRFAVVDAEVDKLYGEEIRGYFEKKGITLTVCVINGGEADKRPQAVDYILDQLCAYKLRRREPFLAIGGGCVLDIAGMAACLYRRGVPFVRVPTTLLAIVDASVGVKNGVDYCCGGGGGGGNGGTTDNNNVTYKNRVGSFYAPSSCLLDPAFIASQDERNVSNGFGEILKLALVRSVDLFELLEAHGKRLVETRFGDESLTKAGVTSRIIDLSIQIMLEELGPNLWEAKLDRCVDYGHTFSKLLEMVPGADIMHGEAVNVDGFFCVLLSHLRGYIDLITVHRIFACMKSLSLPTNSDDLKLDLAWQSCKDAIEHRHGEQRIPLITEIGESICVSDITEEELERALEMMKTFDH